MVTACALISLVGGTWNLSTIFSQGPAPLPFIGVVSVLMSFGLLSLYWISTKPFVDMSSRYWLWERGVESAAKLSIALPAEQVRAAVLEALQEDAEFQITEQHADWIGVSAGKKADRRKHWMAASFLPEPGRTTLVVGIWTKNQNLYYDWGRNKRKVTRLLDAVAVKLAPVRLAPMAYQHNAPVPSKAVSSTEQPLP